MLVFLLHPAMARDSKWQQAFLTQQQSPGENGLTDQSSLSSLRPGYWCFVVDGTFDDPSVDHCVYRACKLGVRLSHYVPMGGKSFAHNRARVETTQTTTGNVVAETRKVGMMI